MYIISDVVKPSVWNPDSSTTSTESSWKIKMNLHIRLHQHYAGHLVYHFSLGVKINDVINNSNAIISLCFIHKQIYSCIHSPPPRPVLLEVIFIIIIISLLLLHYPIMLQINICYTFCCVTIISVLLLIPETRYKHIFTQIVKHKVFI